MGEVDKAILEKIKKLLELSRDPSNEHEAARAAEKAHELLERYNLTIGEVELGAAPSAETHFLCGERPPRYLALLVNACDLLFDCMSIHTREGFLGPASIAICGIPQNVEAAALTLRYLMESIRTMGRARRHLLVLKRKTSARANHRRILSYSYGAACRVMDEIQKAKAAVQADANRQAIVLIGNAIAKRHLEEKYPRRRTVKGRKPNVDFPSFNMGWDDGERINPRGVHKSLPGATEDGPPTQGYGG